MVNLEKLGSRRGILLAMLTVALIIGAVQSSFATHIRAGEIIARRIDPNSLTFEFIFIGYRDRGSTIAFGAGIFRFGDGEEQEGGFEVIETPINNTVARAEFRVIHTFKAPSSYLVSYEEKFRNDGISNMDNSVQTEFYTETMIIIDPFFGVNNSPILTVPPIDEGMPGVTFVHNAGAFDPDGDSLSYQFVTPKRGIDEPVINYRKLTAPEFYTAFTSGSEDGGPPTLLLDEAYGDLIWDAPADIYQLPSEECPEGVNECSEYNLAYRITEWRNIGGVWHTLGYITRDMQIIIYEGDNEKPEIDEPDPLCVTAGETIRESISGADPDGHQIKMEAFGGPFEINQPASYSPGDFQSSPGTLDFLWNTECGHVREQAYEIQLKITDRPIEDGVKVGPSLVDFGTWEIKVVGPAPEGVAVTVESGRSARVSWDNYSCRNIAGLEMEVWRRVGDFAMMPDECEIGMPAGSGYRRIATVRADQNEFVDNRLSPGAKYCYRLVAKFPEPGKGESYVSGEACIILEADAPVITNVDVNRTSSEGEVVVLWTPPYDINQEQFPPPYTYNLFRSLGRNFNAPVEIASGLSDTSFTDTGIDTDLNSFSYRLDLYDGNGSFVDTSSVASTVRLVPDPLLNAIEVNWSASVPWSILMTEYPYHYIYRDHVDPSNPEALMIIDSVDVTRDGFRYLDDGRFNDLILDEDTRYCYYVITEGGYDNPMISSPLINRSQIGCAQPNDNIPPCTPLSVELSDNFDCTNFLIDKGCDFTDFENAIEWQADPGTNCDDDVIYYRIYFSETGEDDFELLDSTTVEEYLHAGLSSYKGCYKISAVDRSKNESPLSEALCSDNCPVFELPNVFTPNGDGKNDTFGPLYSGGRGFVAGFDNAQCPRFVEHVEFKVFDRVGSVVYDLSKEDEATNHINWDGRTNAGLELSAGVYYYHAEVQFDVLEKSQQKQTFKGWVQLMK
ncbi:MAG: gliding motility-associated C-terminal domain-containing protein [Cyclobacteriaceae bacterium]